MEEQKEKNKLVPQSRISPSSVNTWYKCPREYFFSYILKKDTGTNIYFIQGSIIHKVLETFFKTYKPNGRNHIIYLFKKNWGSYKNKLLTLEIPPKKIHQHKKESFMQILRYFNKFKDVSDGLIKLGKAENERHAFYLLKPKIKELWVEDKELHCGGFIDRIHTDYNNLVTLGDYKTGNRFGIGLSKDNRRQLSIYALLYKNQTGITADAVSIIFLRYGEELILEVTPSLLKYARDTILNVWDKTRSTDMSNYPVKEGKLCRWCNFQKICSGETECKEKIRKEKMKRLIKKAKK